MYELTFDNTLVKSTSPEWAKALFAAHVDLSTPGAENFFYFAVYDPTDSELSYRLGKLRIDTTMLITLLQQAAIGELSLMAENDVDLEPSGSYDCETAQYMSIISAYVRNTPVQYKAFAVGPEEVFFLLARNTYFQVSVNDALTKAGYEGVSGQNGIPLIYRDWATFVPPVIPSACGFDKADVGGGVESGPPEGFEDVAYESGGGYSYPTAVFGAVAGAAIALVATAALAGKKRG